MRKRLFAAAVFAAALIFTSAPKTLAYNKDCTLTIIGEKGAYSFTSPEITGDDYVKRLLRLDEVIDDVCFKETVAAQDAYVKFTPDRSKMFTPIAEREGKTVDKVKLKDDVLTCLSVGGGAIKLAYKSIKPQITLGDLQTDIVVRGEFTTSFSSSGEERAENVTLAASAVSGTALNAGEEFSFNDTVGKRSEKNGYKNAKVIMDGEFVDGVGGGVCQVSTTLYNAALLAGLKITEYHPHTLAVSYVESSFDAMVSYGTCDLKFVNVTSYPVYIAAYVRDKNVRFVIYGKKNDCVYERETVVEEVIPMPIENVFNGLLDENEYVVLSHGKNGVKSCGYLVKKRGGKVVSRTLLRRDFYKPLTEKRETGKKGDGLSS